MDEMTSVRTGQVFGALLNVLVGVFTIIASAAIEFITLRALAALTDIVHDTTTTTPRPLYYYFAQQSPYVPNFSSIQYNYVDYHAHQHSHQPRPVYHQVCQWRLVKESGPIKTIYRISSSSATTINTTQIIIIPRPSSLPQLILCGKETEERKNDRINIIRSH